MRKSCFMRNDDEPFFKPYIGLNYSTNNKNNCRVLILGSSFYCHKECVYHGTCTIDSTGYDKICPEYKGKKLSESCYNELWEYIEGHYYKAYDNFVRRVIEAKGYINLDIRREFWNRLAFYNFFQFFLPQTNTPYYWKNEDLFKKQFPPFESVVEKLSPNIIVIWGSQLRDAFADNYKLNVNEVKYSNKYYVVMIKGNRCKLLFVTHPSCPRFSKDRMKLVRQELLVTSWFE